MKTTAFTLKSWRCQSLTMLLRIHFQPLTNRYSYVMPGINNPIAWAVNLIIEFLGKYDSMTERQASGAVSRNV
jgi:hypothetical protein